MVIFHSYVSLPEGKPNKNATSISNWVGISLFEMMFVDHTPCDCLVMGGS